MTTIPFDSRKLSPAKLALLEQRLSGARAQGVSGIPARPPDEPIPLPPVQHGLWVVDQFLADNSVYSVHRELWLRGRLDVAALRASADELVRRHEILRTSYVGDTEPAQLVGPPRPAAFRVVDVSGPAPDARSRAVELAGAELRSPFDLRGGDVFRATLFRVGADEHLLVLNTHHLASDGWSCGVLGRELAALYSAAVRGTRPVLPELEVQYADYAHWQARRVAGDLRERQLDYWRDALGGVRPILTLPTDHAYPERRSYRAARCGRLLSPASTAAIRALARDHGTTLFTALLAVFCVVLHRSSGQDTFAVGSLTSGRDRAEVEHLLGLFANTVAIPADLSGDPSFAELLDRTHRAVLGALDHQDVSFEHVVTAVAPARDATRNPLFQVLFQLVELGEEDWDFTGLDVEFATLHNDSGKVDLALFAADHGECVELDVEYAVDLFEEHTARRFVDRVAAVLDRVAADPLRPLSSVDVMPAAERDLVLSAWNDTAMEVPRATVAELFEAAVERTPDAPAIVDVDGSTVHYAELNARANRLAHHLRTLGVVAESLVGVCVEHSVDLFVALLGVLKAGGAYVPLDPEHPADRLAFMLADTGARVVVTQDRVAAAVPPDYDGTLVSLDRDAVLLACSPDTDPTPSTGPDNLVYVMYTSGSTGRPKGVMISHAGLVNYLWWAIGGYGLDGASGAPMLGSIAFDLSVPNFFLPLIGGKDVTLLPKDRSLATLTELLRRRGDFSLLKLTPGHLDVLRGMLVDTDRVDSVRTFVVGADEVRPETVAAWRRIAPGARIIDEYGPTETVVGCSTYLIGEDFDPAVPVSIGRPIANTRMYVLDSGFSPVPVGAVGELFIGGAGVARGYLDRRGLTAEKFVPDPFDGAAGARMYRTGDLARHRADGNLDFLGRIDHQVKIRGYRIELGEIEARLLLHPQVSEAVVVAREESAGHKRLVGYVVPVPQTRPGVDELRAFVAQTLPDYMIPAAWAVLPELPLTQGGKVDRNGLPEPDAARPGSAAATAEPSTPAEIRLCAIWAQVLGLDRVGVHDDFFELGGDSILAIQIVAAVRQTEFAVTVRQVFEHRTVGRLAEAVAATAAVEVHADQHAVSGEVAMTPVLHWFFEQSTAADHYNQSVLVDCDPSTDVAVLRQALVELVAHHDMLRLRLSGSAGRWSARIVPADDRPVLRVVDLFGLSESRRREVRARVGSEIQTGLSLRDGPIVAAALFTGDDRRGDQLLIAIHHAAVDTVSWNILLEDLGTACGQLESGVPVALPAKSTSFQHWAHRLTEYARSAEFAAEAAHWAGLADSRPPELPVDHVEGPNTEGSVRSIDLALSAELTDALVRRVPAAYRTEINDALLAALACTLTEWAGGHTALVELEGHGREQLFDDVDISRTVGWFTTLFPVALTVADGDWGARLKAVKEQLRAAPRHGIGHGLARHLREDTASALSSATAAPISFNYLGRVDQQRGAAARFRERDETLGATRDPQGRRPYLVEVTAVISEEVLSLRWNYSANRHEDGTVRRLAERYLTHLTALIDHCASGGEGATPSDFPLAGLDSAGLDGLLDGLRTGADPVRPGDVEDLYPLSPLQAGMLFRAVYDPDSQDYFEQTGFVICGELDAEAFARSCRRAVERHAVLRSRFAWHGLSAPVQVVLRHHEAKFTALDWTAGDPADLPSRLDELLSQERRTGFDLAAESPCRFTVVTTAPDRHHFLWSYHHIVLDAWSVSSVLDEILACYQALRCGRPDVRPKPVPYRDYIAWLLGQDRAADDAFWRAELAGAAGPTTIPGRTVAEAGPGVEHARHVPPGELVTGVQELALRSHCTVATVLQSAWALLLSRYSGQYDVLFGTTVAGRSADTPGIERMVGMLINTVPTRVLIDPDQSVSGYLAARQAKQLELRDREHCALVDVQHCTAIPAGTPLFDNIFIYENFTRGDVDVDGVDIEPLAQVFEQTDCPFVLEVSHHGDLRMQVTYHRSHFDAATCDRLLGHYANLIQGMVDHPAAPLWQLETMPDDDRRAVVRQGSDALLRMCESGGTLPPDVRSAGSRMYVLDDRLFPVPVGAAGELFVGGVLADRRFRRPRQAAEHLLPDPFAETPGARMCRTGEFARLLGDGTAEFRADPTATTRPGGDGRPAGPPEVHVAPRTPTETSLAGIWADLLGLDRVGVHDDFFELGGDSMLSFQVVGHAHRKGVAVTVRQIFELRTVGRLAEVVDAVDDVPSPEGATVAEAKPVDFPLAGLDAAALDRLLSEPGSDEIVDVYRLSPLQAGMLVETLGADGADPYFRQWVYDIDGDLDVRSFTRAWQHVIDRHAILRTRFAWEGLPHPVQLVCRTLPMVVERWDCRGVPDDERAAWLERLAADERARGIDLDTAPPLRFLFVRTGEHSHQFIWNTHHILLDGWSIAVVLDEVFAVYRALASGRRPPTLAEPVPFRVFVDWLDRRSGDDIAYWTDLLDGFGDPTPSPAARRTGLPSGMGVADHLFSAELAAAVRTGARRHRVTVSTVAQAAWALLLSRYSGDSEVSFGVTVAGRSAELPGIERIAGMLMNTLPARVSAAASTTIGDWLSSLHDEQVRRYGYEHHSLIDIRRWTGFPNGRPMFDTRFVFESSTEEARFDCGGVLVSNVSVVQGESEYPAVIAVSDVGERVAAQLRYDRAHYDTRTARLLLAEYADLVDAVVTAEPGAQLGALVSQPRLGSGGRRGGQHGAVPGIPVAEPSFEPPRTACERALARIWADVLGIADVGVHNDFFDVGGNSILVFQVVARAHQAGLGVTVRQALRHRTIAELADAVADVDPAPASRGNDDVPLTPVLRRFTAQDINHAHHNQSMLLTWRTPPDPSRLESALRVVVAAHDALRFRLRRGDRDWRLDVAGTEGEEPLRVLDLTGLAEADADGVVLRVANEINATLDPARGPLLRAALFLDNGIADGVAVRPARLLVAAHHITVDTVSWTILLDDLASAYHQLGAGTAVSLPPVATSYPQWARRMAEHANSAVVAEESTFWLAHRPSVPDLPVDRPGGRNTEATERVVETVLPEDVTRTLLRDVPTAFGAHLDEVLLSAVGSALTRWTGSDDTVVDVEGHGRELLFDDVDLGRTVGWFTTVHPVHLHLPGSDDAVRRLTGVSALMRAAPSRGLGYGLARYLRPDTAAALAKRPDPQVVFTYSGQWSERSARDDHALFDVTSEAPGAVRDPGSPRSHLLAVNAAVIDGRVVINWAYSAELHERETIERVAGHCLDELGALASLCRTSGPAAAGPRTGAPHQRLAERLFPQAPALTVPMARHGVLGASVALIVAGAPAGAWGQGVVDEESSAPVLPGTPFQSCSVSKHVTALGVLRLVQEGRLDLDEDIGEYLTSWRLPVREAGGGPITVRQLLRHRAGLTADGSFERPYDEGVPELGELLASVRHQRRAGAGFHYTNVNFAVVQQVVADVTGSPFPAAMRSLVIDPLGLRDSGYEQDFPATHLGEVARGHCADGTPYVGSWPVIPDIASSGLWSTAGDLAKVELEILRAATGGPTAFLSRELAEQMVTPGDGDYGLGTAIARGPAAHWFGHPGDRRSYQGFTAVDLHSGTGLVVLANIGGDAPFLGDLVNELGLGIHYKIR